MMRPVLYCLLSVSSLGLANSRSLGRQQPNPPPTAASLDASAPKSNEKPSALTPLEEAEALYRTGKFNKAVEQYNAIIASSTNKAAAYAGLARVYLRLNKPNDAYLAATKAIEHDPSLGTAHSGLGEVYFRQGKIDDAQTEFQTALKLSQVDARAYLGLARLYRATYNFKKAKVAIDKAHSLDPSDPDIADAWVATRPLSEQEQALEDKIAARSDYYSRVERAGFKQQLTLIRDEIEHPERTCRLASPLKNTEVQLTSMGPKTDLIGLKVDVNGVDSHLVLGTVSSGIVINSEIAEAAGVQSIAREDIDALGEQNPPEAHIGFARTLRIENLEFQNCYVTVIDKASPRSFYDQFEGLIPAGFFSAYLVDIDIPHMTLSLQPLPSRPASEDQDRATMDSGDPDARNFHDRYTAPSMAAWTQMYHFGGAIAVPARVNNSPPALFEVEVSSMYNVLAPEFARERASLKSDLRSKHLEGINGKISAESSGKVNLTLADLHLKKIRVISFDDTRSSDSQSQEIEIAGYLGLDLLSYLRFIIDYRDGFIHFIFAPGFPQGR